MIEGINYKIIKFFEFPEPVFNRRRLKRKFKFLSDHNKINRLLNKKGEKAQSKIKNIGFIKPIKNPNSPKDRYWRPFKRYYDIPYNHVFSQRTEKGLFMIPMQIIHNEWTVGINETKFEDLLEQKIENKNISIQMRIYPPGYGSVHLTLYVDFPKKADWLKSSLNLRKKLHQISLYLIDKKQKRHSFTGLHRFLDYIVKNTLSSIVNDNVRYRIADKHLCFIVNAQGVNFKCKKSEVEKILGKFEKGDYYKAEKGDIFAVKDGRAFLFIDKNLLKRRTKVFRKIPDQLINGRKCFRDHFVNTIELGYISSLLFKHYLNVLIQIDRELYLSKMTYKTDRIMKILQNRPVLSPVFCKTFYYITQVPDLLYKIDDHSEDIWMPIFNTILKQNLAENINEIKKWVDNLFQRAVNENEKNLETTCYVIGKALGKITDILSKKIPL
jgi:hypothetical protein